jgi:hypothetical protein
MGGPALWTADGARFFVNDGNQSSYKRPRVISVHKASGAQIGVLPVGDALSSHVLAASKDGLFAVTRTDLYNSARPKRRRPNELKSTKFELWDLR